MFSSFKLLSSLSFYSIISHLGYGNVAPVTVQGKLATIVYAIAGMPLFLLYLSNIGDILAKSFKWIYAKCCLCRGCPTRPRDLQRTMASTGGGLPRRTSATVRSRRWNVSEQERFEKPDDATAHGFLHSLSQSRYWGYSRSEVTLVALSFKAPHYRPEKAARRHSNTGCKNLKE